MQIISELEGYRRGIYAGAVGYAFRREASSTRASRSARSCCATASRTCQAGGGIVADSDPAAEHEECLNKLRALEAAIELARRS